MPSLFRNVDLVKGVRVGEVEEVLRLVLAATLGVPQ